MLEFPTALQRIVASAQAPGKTIEQLELRAAAGRYLAEDMQATIAVPGFANSAMDGYAVRHADLVAGESMQVVQRIVAGQQANPLEPGSAARIFTGAMMPPGADTVILQEDAQVDGTRVSFVGSATFGQHIRPEGQDVAVGATLARRGQRIDAAMLGQLASAGFATLPCYRAPRVAFFSTGDELVEPGQALILGQIYSSNSYALHQQLLQVGAQPVDMGYCKDSSEATRDRLCEAAGLADCVITTGGMSVGEEDHVLAQASRLGEIDFWKIAMKPGKPFAFGQLNGATFFGLPGNPVSAYVTFELLVRPWLLKTMGATSWQHKAIDASAGFDFSNKGSRLDFLRGKISLEAKGGFSVSLFENQSSGVMSSLVDANVLVPVAPRSSIVVGQRVTAIPLANKALVTGAENWPG